MTFRKINAFPLTNTFNFFFLGKLLLNSNCTLTNLKRHIRKKIFKKLSHG